MLRNGIALIAPLSVSPASSTLMTELLFEKARREQCWRTFRGNKSFLLLMILNVYYD